MLYIMREITRTDRIRYKSRDKDIDLRKIKGKGKVKIEIEQDDADMQEDSSARTLDRLCLALGLLANLVQEAPEAKIVLRELGKPLSRTHASSF